MTWPLAVAGIAVTIWAGFAHADPAAALQDSAVFEFDSLRVVAPPTSGSLDEEPLPDTSRVTVEIGARTDVTNESYYEDAFVDTTFLGRRLVNTPESRYAGVAIATWTGTRGDRASRYSLLSELSAGDRLQRAYAGLRWRSPLSTDWTLHLDPTFEFRHDRTFDRDLDELRASVRSRVRREFLDGLTAAELGVRADLLRASGVGSEFLLDRNSAGVSGAIDHLGVQGDDWRLGYGAQARAFPDSSERDHLEQSIEGRAQWASSGARPSLTIEGLALRRSTFEPASTSRDNYWNLEGSLDTRFAGVDRWPITAGVGGELFRYDDPDSTLFFDYGIARARAALRWEPDGRWALGLGPRGEILTADFDPGESYQEIGGALEAERLGGGSWWSVGLASGWRDYDPTPAAGPNTPPLHSSYAFHELEATADQPLGARLRLRLLAVLRWERHVDSSQDAGSVYLTSELRWIP